MTALIVGGDYIESLKQELSDHGVERVEHWVGRKVGDLKRTIPSVTRIVVVLLNYVSHNHA